MVTVTIFPLALALLLLGGDEVGKPFHLMSAVRCHERISNDH